MDAGVALLVVGILLLVVGGYQLLPQAPFAAYRLAAAEGFLLLLVGLGVVVQQRRMAVVTKEGATGWLVVGVILALVGVLVFISQGGAVGECQTFFGQLGRALSAEVQQRCSTANLLRTVGGVVAVGGFIVTLVGIVWLAASSSLKSA